MFVALRLSVAAASQGYSSLWCVNFSLWRLFLLWSTGSADGDCSHEIKRRILLGRKVMTNLKGILKSRDITLPTKVHLVKAMVFPVVTYGCESWTIKKAECRRICAFELWCWRRLLRVPCLRPYHPERTRSRLISEAKQGRAWLVLGWEFLGLQEDPTSPS